MTHDVIDANSPKSVSVPYRQFSVVLMRPQGSFNIGATARAMQNMGLDRLVIVAARCDVDENARKGAATAQGLLARRIEYPSLDEFYQNEGEGVRIGFTGKDLIKGGIWEFRDFVQKELVLRIQSEWSGRKVYLVFGSEDDGLSLEEHRLMNWNVRLPTFGENPSLNLSQAVLMAGLILQEELSKAGLKPALQGQGRLLPEEPLEFDEKLLSKFLSSIGFQLEQKRRKSALDVLRQVLLRGIPNKDEFKILADVFQQTIRKMEERRILLSEKQTGFKPIGFIESPFRTKFGTPRQPGLVPSAKAKLKLRRDLQPELSLQGLEGFSHAWLIFEFHENTNKIFRPKIHPPRLAGKTVGVFATRSPHRPNPIGLSLVKIENVERDGLQMSGIDLIDGTPVIDIKPYVPGIESPKHATGGWLGEVADKNWKVEFSAGSAEFLQSLPLQEGEHLQALIKESLALDPRPVLYREMFDPEAPQEHAVYLENFDVHFQYEVDKILVVKIRRSNEP